MEKKRSKQKLKLAAKKPQKALESIWRLEDKGAGPSGVELEPGGGRDEDPVSKQQTKLASQTFPPPPLSLSLPFFFVQYAFVDSQSLEPETLMSSKQATTPLGKPATKARKTPKSTAKKSQ